jgi:predicted KAP-like P-loop ATPase
MTEHEATELDPDHPDSASGQVPDGPSADRPLSDPGDDRLGYAPFAAALAKGIGEMSAPDGLVVAIYGAWGLGKTTVLNFVEHYLGEQYPNEFVVVRFNPWWFTGRVDIAAAFFAQLRGIFDKWQVRGERARGYAAGAARIAGAFTGTSLGDVARDLIEGDPATVPELKKKLADSLAASDTRLLIQIDDIDRLTADEVAELFAVVKSLADFPNTIYLLAFDRDQVAGALSTRVRRISRSGLQEQSGFDYLDKIVQVPFELPLPEREALRALLIGSLHEIVGEVDEDLFDAEQFNALLHRGLLKLLKTPRDIVRLTNSLRVTYGAVRGEVNVVDFVALEALRVFTPSVYDRIRTRPDMFGVLGGTDALFPELHDDERKAFHETWMSEIVDAEERDAVTEIVGELLPRLAQLLELRIVTRRRRIDSRRTRSLSEPEYFPLYFRFALGDQVVSRDLIATVIASAGDAAAFSQQLLALAETRTANGRTRASAMLDELVAQAEEGFSAGDAPTVIKTLIDMGDKLWLDGDDEFFGANNPTRIVWLVGGLLDRVERENRCELLTDAIRDAHSVGTPTLLVRRIIRGLGVGDKSSTRDTSPTELDERNALVDAECAVALEAVAAERIAAAAESGQLFTTDRMLWVLAEWGRWGDVEAPKDWVARVLAQNDTLSRFLLAARGERISSDGLRYRLDPRSIDPYSARQDVIAAVRRLRETIDDGSDVAVAADQYLLEYEMLEGGSDPERASW